MWTFVYKVTYVEDNEKMTDDGIVCADSLHDAMAKLEEMYGKDSIERVLIEDLDDDFIDNNGVVNGEQLITALEQIEKMHNAEGERE